MTGFPPLALVESLAHRKDGHYGRTLLALATAHGEALVLVPRAAPASLKAQLTAVGGKVVIRQEGPAGVALSVCGSVTAVVAAGAGRLFASRRWPLVVRRLPHQSALLARALHEAARIRTAHRLAPDAAVVVLTAAPGLHALVGQLGGEHQRFVHEVTTTEDLPLRLIDRISARGLRRTVVFAPTRAVRDQVAARFPAVTVHVRAYGLAQAADRVGPDERRQARSTWLLSDRETAVALVGGWWPEKDLPTVHRALTELTRPIHLLVTGSPLDEQRLAQWRQLPHVNVRLLPAPATDAAVRDLYAAADATLVCRRPGVGKESGLVADALRFGVPLICSDHHPELSAKLSGRPWVRTFPAGHAQQLAQLLDELAERPIPRPDPNAVAQMGLPTPTDQIVYLTHSQEACPP